MAAMPRGPKFLPAGGPGCSEIRSIIQECLDILNDLRLGSLRNIYIIYTRPLKITKSNSRLAYRSEVSEADSFKALESTGGEFLQVGGKYFDVLHDVIHVGHTCVDGTVRDAWIDIAAQNSEAVWGADVASVKGTTAIGVKFNFEAWQRGVAYRHLGGTLVEREERGVVELVGRTGPLSQCPLVRGIVVVVVMGFYLFLNFYF